MPYAKRDRLSLYYEQRGSGAPPLLSIHGWCCDHTFFQPQFDHFGTSHAVTALDLRGHGRSDRPEDGYGNLEGVTPQLGCLPSSRISISG